MYSAINQQPTGASAAQGPTQQRTAAVGLAQSTTSAAGPVQSPAVGPVHSTSSPVGQSAAVGQVLGAGGPKQRPSLNLAMVFGHLGTRNRP